MKKPVWTIGQTEARSRQGQTTYVLGIAEVKRVLSDPSVTQFEGVTINHRTGKVTVSRYDVSRNLYDNNQVTAFGCQSLTGKNDLKLLKKWAGVQA